MITFEVKTKQYITHYANGLCFRIDESLRVEKTTKGAGTPIHLLKSIFTNNCGIHCRLSSQIKNIFKTGSIFL